MKVISCLFVFVLLAILLGCTDATVSQITTFGNSGHITCYSGGKVIYDGVSTGKIATESSSDGWFFKDSSSGKLIRVSGACVIVN